MKKNVLLISDRPQPPPALAEIFQRLNYTLTVETDPRALFQYNDIRRIDLVLVMVRSDDPTSWTVLQLIGDTISATHLPVVALGESLAVQDRVRAFQMGVTECLGLDLSPEELEVRFTVLASHKRRFDNLVDNNIRTVLMARQLRQNADKLDEEMRLARRIQMDFLPHKMPEVGQARFAARLYPAGWVAGDFYDAFRLDENHVGFYVADAIGHGVPAALLTIFVKHSLKTKRITRNSYELIPPHESLSLLNAELLQAELQQSPFISMIYCIVNTATGQVSFSRAGHPRPILIRGHEPTVDLPGEGPLLGILPNAVFELAECQLQSGDRLMLYTDGVERCRTETADGCPAFCQLAAQANGLGLEPYLQTLLDAVLKPRADQPIYDDVTLLVMEMTVGKLNHGRKRPWHPAQADRSTMT